MQTNHKLIIIIHCKTYLSNVVYCIVLYCIMRPYTDGPIRPLSYRHSSGVVRNPYSAYSYRYIMIAIFRMNSFSNT